MEKVWPQTFGKLTHGIYVLTTFHKIEINGMIASWVSQVSYEPPLVMVAIHPNRYSHHLIEQSNCFALHVLARNQTELIERFKTNVPTDKFDSIHWYRGKTDCPILKECVAYIECKVMEKYRPGNHTLFIGEVQDAQIFSDGTPLSTSDYKGMYLGKD